MIISTSGIGLQKLLSQCSPVFVWDAFRAITCTGKGIEGEGRVSFTATDNGSRTPSKWCRWVDNRLEYMSAVSDTELGQETLFGPCGEFYTGTITGYQAWSSSRLGFAVVSPTTTDCWIDYSGTYPDIIKNPTLSGTDHCERFAVDSDDDAVNDVVIEKSMTRSATYNRHFWVLTKGTGDPTGIIELGWNASSGTRTTESPWVRKLPNSDWYMLAIIVPSGATTGYGSIKVSAGNGVWEFACATFHAIYSTFEKVPRFGIRGNSDRGKWDVHTTNAEIQLKPEGWIAMSIVLPDMSVDNGHVDFAGASNYKFLGMFNLDCGTYRLRVSMSDTYDQIVVNLGTTAGVNFSFLRWDSSWDSFEAIGLVATWEINNGNYAAALYINGEKVASTFNPADWYPENLDPGTAYIGISDSDGVSAEAWISRVAYGNSFMHRSYARKLSTEMQKLCRGHEGAI